MRSGKLPIAPLARVGGASSVYRWKTIVPSPYSVKIGVRLARKAGMTNPPPSS
jgi:hypothetical protein